jgi:hemerythrin
MPFTWTRELSTGIADIDTQHQELLSRLNNLIGGIRRRKKDREAVRGYIEYLREYIAFHFAAEEREMTMHRYPGLAEHEAEHEQFKKQVNQLYHDYLSEGTSEKVFEETVWASGVWFVDHIHKTDKKMAAFLIQLTKAGSKKQTSSG